MASSVQRRDALRATVEDYYSSDSDNEPYRRRYEKRSTQSNANAATKRSQLPPPPLTRRKTEVPVSRLSSETGRVDNNSSQSGTSRRSTDSGFYSASETRLVVDGTKPFEIEFDGNSKRAVRFVPGQSGNHEIIPRESGEAWENSSVFSEPRSRPSLRHSMTSRGRSSIRMEDGVHRTRASSYFTSEPRQRRRSVTSFEGRNHRAPPPSARQASWKERPQMYDPRRHTPQLNFRQGYHDIPQYQDETYPHGHSFPAAGPNSFLAPNPFAVPNPFEAPNPFSAPDSFASHGYMPPRFDGIPGMMLPMTVSPSPHGYPPVTVSPPPHGYPPVSISPPPQGYPLHRSPPPPYMYSHPSPFEHYNWGSVWPNHGPPYMPLQTPLPFTLPGANGAGRITRRRSGQERRRETKELRSSRSFTTTRRAHSISSSSHSECSVTTDSEWEDSCTSGSEGAPPHDAPKVCSHMEKERRYRQREDRQPSRSRPTSPTKNTSLVVLVENQDNPSDINVESSTQLESKSKERSAEQHIERRLERHGEDDSPSKQAYDRGKSPSCVRSRPPYDGDGPANIVALEQSEGIQQPLDFRTPSAGEAAQEQEQRKSHDCTAGPSSAVLRELVNEMLRRHHVKGKAQDPCTGLGPTSSANGLGKEHVPEGEVHLCQTISSQATNEHCEEPLGAIETNRTSLSSIIKPVGQSQIQPTPSLSHDLSVSDEPVANDIERRTTTVSSSGEHSEITLEEDDVGIKNALDTAMEIIKRLLLRDLLSHTLSEVSKRAEWVKSSNSGSQTGSTGASSSSRTLTSTTASTSGGAQTRKRTRSTTNSSGDGGESGDDNSEDDDDTPRKKNGKGLAGRLPIRRVKCPFHQREPEKYPKASCRGPGFADMAKLKDHIKRVHVQPLRCARCWLVMASDDAFDEHMQQDNACEKKLEPHDDRIRPHVLRQLDFKKAPYVNTKTTDEKWKILFKVLFPEEESIPSPYEQQTMSPRLERALSKALEEELTRELEPLLGPIMDRIKATIPAIIERCREELGSDPPSSPSEETASTTTPQRSDVGPWKRTKHCVSSTLSSSSRSSIDTTPTTPIAPSSENFGMSSRHAASLLNSHEMKDQAFLSSWCTIGSDVPHQPSRQKMPGTRKIAASGASINEPVNDPSLVPEALVSNPPQTSNNGILETARFLGSDFFTDRNHVPNETLPDFDWDDNLANCNMIEGPQARNLEFFINDQEPMPSWDYWMKDLDFPLFPTE